MGGHRDLTRRNRSRFVRAGAFAAALTGALLIQGNSGFAASLEGGPALSDEPIPMKTPEEMPQRVAPLIEIGGAFLGPGDINEGFELPTGAVWIPQLWVYGNIRTALNFVERERGGQDVAEAAVRADVNFNLKLTATERFFMQVQPLHDEEGFTTYAFEDGRDETSEHASFRITNLFFEGDLGEMFPNLDPSDEMALDIGFAVGRMPIFFQEGMLINDRMDAVGLVRDTVIFPGVIDTKFTALFAWNEVNRNDNDEDDEALLFGLFTETDLRKSTVAADIAYVDSDDSNGGDGIFLGLSSVQRISDINTAFRVNQSFSLDGANPQVNTGTLFFSEVSFTPLGTHDLVYWNAFLGIEQFSSASRDINAGGPLGRVGLLFAAPGIGRAPAPLGNRAEEAWGGAVGYQMFFNDDATQVVLEAGGIKSGADFRRVRDGAGAGFRVQHKFLERYLVQLDGFYTYREVERETVGGRVEFLVQF